MGKSFWILLCIFQTLNCIAQKVDYFVPVSPELEEYAHFKLKDLTVYHSDDKVTLSFSLPRKLTGIALPKMEFSGPRSISPLVLEGSLGRAFCHEQAKKLSRCFIQYNQQYQDTLERLDPLVKKAMVGQISDPDELLINKMIWESFSSDPLGIITFSLCPEVL